MHGFTATWRKVWLRETKLASRLRGLKSLITVHISITHANMKIILNGSGIQCSIESLSESLVYQNFPPKKCIATPAKFDTSITIVHTI